MAKSIVSKSSGSSQVKKTCKQCGFVFWVRKSRQKRAKYCSVKCRIEDQKKSALYQLCEHCGEKFRVFPSRHMKCKYCSKECRVEHEKNITFYQDCECCGVTFKVTKAQQYNRVRFCSNECRAENRKKKSTKIKKTCENCGSDFWVSKSRALAARYCCYACRTTSVEIECLNCKKMFSATAGRKDIAKFCSKYCYTIYTRGENHPRFQGYVASTCLFCGSEFYLSHWEAKKRKFCSHECASEHNAGENHHSSVPHIEKTCVYCGQSFLVREKEAPYRIRCSKECAIKDNILPKYELYADKISFAIDVRRCGKNKRYLEVKCSYCGKWHSPDLKKLYWMVHYFDKSQDVKFYCSDGCKDACPVFGQQKYPKGFKRASSREVSPDLRQMCLERDGWECQRCGKTEPPLHCHHIDGAVQNKIISNDLENVITLCKACHKEVHKQDGCKYHELRCDVNNVQYDSK